MNKRNLIVVLFALFFGGLLVWLVAKDPGYILIAFGEYSLEMSFWAAILALLVLWLALRLVYWFFSSAGSAGRKIIDHDWFDRKGRNRLRMGNGMLQLMEGRWQPAKKNLEGSAKYSDMPLMNLLGAATAAYELDDKPETDRLLELAENKASNTMAVDIVRARLLLRQKSYASAIAVLEKLHRGNPNNTFVLSMMVTAYQGSEDWPKLQGLLPDIKRLHALPKDHQQELRVLVTKNRLKSLAKEVVENNNEQTLGKYNNFWHELSRSLRNHPAVLKVHLQCLYEFGEGVEVEKALRKFLSKVWDEELVRLYGLVEGQSAASQLMTAEAWLVEHAKSEALLVTLSRLCQRNLLWVKAREYLELAAKEKPSAEVYFNLAQLSASRGESEKSMQYFTKASLLVER